MKRSYLTGRRVKSGPTVWGEGALVCLVVGWGGGGLGLDFVGFDGGGLN